MSLYQDTLDQIIENKKIREEGRLISIPWVNLPRLSKVLPGVMKEQYVCVTAQSKIGKTQLGDFLYLYQIVDFLYNNPKCGVTAKILYFSLEMSVQAKMRQAMSYRLFNKYRISVSPQKIQSVFEGYIVDDKVLKLIQAEKEWFDFFQSIVTFHDTHRNPFGIYNTVKTYCEMNGRYTYKEIDWTNPDGSVVKKRAIDQYIANDPNEIVVGIYDHVSLLSVEQLDGGSLQKAMGRFSSEYCLSLRDRYKVCNVAIQQQMPTGEQQQFTSSGSSIVDKLKPTADSLGDNKRTSRDYNLMLGLFGPHRYGFKDYNGYNLDRLQDNFRELSILLNRDGISNASIGLYFNGASNYFKELPKPEDIKESDYSTIEKIRSQII